ncbi:MAG: cob(I)yrinic acid a,c-diamide adenosyltransferase [Eubacterium sp.]
MIHIYYGYGKGKTCAAIGAGMRAVGSGMTVSLVQFLKDDTSGELGVLPFEIYRSPHSLSFNPGAEYQPWVDGAMEHISHCDSQVIILDEFLDIIPDYVGIDDALSLLTDDKEYIITGHKNTEKLFECADYVTFFEKKRHPYDRGINARRGIEF